MALVVPIYRSADVVPVRGGAAGADCAAPHLGLEGVRRDTTAVLHPGEKITLTGRYYVNGCQEHDHEPAPSSMAVTIYLKGHGRPRALAKATGTGPEGRFTTTVRIPTGYPHGKATLQAGPHGKWSTVNVFIAESAAPTQ